MIHISSTSRISAGNTSSIACTPASASACFAQAPISGRPLSCLAVFAVAGASAALPAAESLRRRPPSSSGRRAVLRERLRATGRSLLEHVTQRALRRREGERHAIGARPRSAAPARPRCCRTTAFVLRISASNASLNDAAPAGRAAPGHVGCRRRRWSATARALGGRRRRGSGGWSCDGALAPATASEAGGAAGAAASTARPDAAAAPARSGRLQSDPRSASASAGESSAAAPSRGDTAAARRSGCPLRRASADRTRAAGPRARNGPASAVSRSRSPSPAISGSLTREGSTDSTSRSRTTRDSSRQTSRRS